MKNHPFLNRVGFACSGLKTAWATENSFRAQVAAALFVLLLLIVIQPTLIWSSLLLIISGLVLAAELFNTALEKLIDHLHPDQHDAIKVIKDIMAGAILVLSITALVIFGLFVWNMFRP
ncbi:MAG: diacylglycerol kinase [Alphaproteobacteria bacterium]|nr:diacylglycerol kinase [Alphaproteobacteria bacterium]